MKVVLAIRRVNGPEGGDNVVAVASTVEKAKQLLGEMLTQYGDAYGGTFVFNEVEVDVTIAPSWYATVGNEPLGKILLREIVGRKPENELE